MKTVKTITPLLIVLLFMAGVFQYFNSAPSLMQDETIYIREGDTLISAARNLKKLNAVESESFFRALSVFAGKSRIIAGKYRFSRGSSSLEILLKIMRGDVLKTRVTIPEGYNLYQIADRLEKKGATNGKAFLKLAFNREFLKSLGISADSAEGYLFPDTYIFPEESHPRDIIKAMNARLRNVLSGLDLSNMKRMGFDTHRLLIMASMIEKEARVASERRYISAVFHNRVRHKMKFDCDPTVRYAVNKFTGSITRADLASTSPFNTYYRYGYPPTPICSSGRESIIAALNPTDAPYLYFVSRNDGSHYFSRTLGEHSRAVNYYQRGIKNGFVDQQRL